jgi:hypothetical protein
MDVVHALRRHGRTLYGFGAWSIHLCIWEMFVWVLALL